MQKRDPLLRVYGSDVGCKLDAKRAATYDQHGRSSLDAFLAFSEG
jgi:hypothetical protein